MLGPDSMFSPHGCGHTMAGAGDPASDGLHGSGDPATGPDWHPQSIGYEVRPRLDFNAETISLETLSVGNGIAERLSLELCNLKDKAVRQALIALGWTPPTTPQPPFSHVS